MSTFWKKPFNSKEKVRPVVPLLKTVFQFPSVILQRPLTVPSLSPPTHSSQGILEMRGSLCPSPPCGSPRPATPGGDKKPFLLWYHQEGGGEEKEVTVGGAGGCIALLLLREGASTRSELHLTKPPALPPVAQFTLSATGGRVIFTHRAPWNARSLN